VPRAIWSGSLSFGLVNVPVKLYSATQDKDVHFSQFDKSSGKRIRNKRVREDTGREIEFEDIVKGYEKAKGRYVLVTPQELESVEPGPSRTIEVEEFVALEEVDPIYFDKTYYLEPADNEGAKRAYALLREAMEDTGKVAIARFVMRGKQYLASIRPSRSVLVLETMRFPDEIRDPNDLDLPGKIKLSDRERKIAHQLVESLATEFDPKRYRDTYRKRVLDLIERKAGGEEIVVESPAQKAEAPVDLLAALEASINAAKARRKAPSSTRKSATARKRAAPKSKATKKKTGSTR
jgi:DNA end-binding protein Ku